MGRILIASLIALEALLIFSLGFISFMVINEDSLVEFPLSINSYEKASPSDYIEERNILVYKDRVVIMVDNPSLSKYADTNSMLPVLDIGAKGIKVVPESESEIHIGDIVSFEFEDKIVVHRIINIGRDKEGKYYITKGDNNPFAEDKIRFEDIKSKTIAIIY
jgi:signal peptidase I